MTCKIDEREKSGFVVMLHVLIMLHYGARLMMKVNKSNEGSQGIYRGNWPGAEIEMTEEERATAMGAMGGEGVPCKTRFLFANKKYVKVCNRGNGRGEGGGALQNKITIYK